MHKIVGTAITCVLLIVTGYVRAEAACVLNEYETTQLLLAPERADSPTCEKDLSKQQLTRALRVVVSYWDTKSTSRQRYILLSKRYQELLARGRQIGPDQYTIPGFEPERVWQGYRFNEINIVAGNRVEVSVQVKWEQEGYQGTMTYLMECVLDAGQWLIVGIHY